MNRWTFAAASALLAWVRVAAGAAAAGDEPCRDAYVVPYAEQCTFAYGTLKRDTSAANLSAAFAACARAQDVAVTCVSGTDRGRHVVALGALYRDVTQQAEIALFAQQFGVAQALLHEKLQVLDVAAREPGADAATLARERRSTKTDLADAVAGSCTTRALVSTGRQRDLAKRRAYADLSLLLKARSQAYAACARLATSPAKRAYIEYAGLVAMEESGRAAQAAGRRDDARTLYDSCAGDARRAAGYAAPVVRRYLDTVTALCEGRRDGRYGVDQPEPIDAAASGASRPLTLPK